MPTRKGHLTQRFGGTPLTLEPRGWFVEREADRARRALFGPFQDGVERRHVHPGIDIGLARGTPLRAVESGRVTRIGTYASTGERYLRLRIRPGVYAFYTHLRGFRCNEGDSVVRGQVVAVSGNTGLSTGPHLHFEVRRRQDGGLFRYSPRRLFEGGDLADAPWILSDLPPPAPRSTEDDMPLLISYQPGSTAVLGAGTEVRSAPSSGAQLIRIVDEPEEQIIVGFVRGQSQRDPDRWLMWGGGETFEYAHDATVEVLPEPPLVNVADVVNQAVVAALDAQTRGRTEVPQPDHVEDDDDEPDDDVI